MRPVEEVADVDCSRVTSYATVVERVRVYLAERGDHRVPSLLGSEDADIVPVTGS